MLFLDLVEVLRDLSVQLHDAVQKYLDSTAIGMFEMSYSQMIVKISKNIHHALNILRKKEAKLIVRDLLKQQIMERNELADQLFKEVAESLDKVKDSMDSSISREIENHSEIKLTKIKLSAIIGAKKIHEEETV